jgi:cytochrome c oxidase cbb3-type subunit I
LEQVHLGGNKAARFDIIFIAIISALVAFWALFAAARAEDVGIAVHAWIVLGTAVLTGACLVFNATGNGLNYDNKVYSDGVIRYGVIASVFWGIVGMLIGVVIASQLAFPEALSFKEYGFLNFGRLRPLHTSAVIFAFCGNVLLATSFYVVQRTCRARLFGGILPWFVFWGYQLFIVLAATGYLLGVTSSLEYAEPTWHVDLWLTIVWVAYLLVFLGTLWKRKEPHIYVANWFYLAFIVTIAMLHVVHNMAVPTSIFASSSYPLFGGVQNALTQWWYGHNAVGFFLTAGFLAIMYYFIPKQVNRPIYSYQLSIVHFWSLIFIYIWAGPHHLHYTALPQWAQTLGMVFSVVLWMPSWGGMINGLMTLSGAWDKLRTDPVVRMFVASLAFYGMGTFEGPVMAVRAVNSLSHYTDWTIGHVHSAALGWNGLISFGALYAMTPWLWKRARLYSVKLVETHFWLATIGILFYISSMWVAGIQQGLMWRDYNEFGFLTYSFVETVKAMHLPYIVRALGGALYLSGMVILAYNLYRTMRGEISTKEPLVGAMPAPDGPSSTPISPGFVPAQ